MFVTTSANLRAWKIKRALVCLSMVLAIIACDIPINTNQSSRLTENAIKTTQADVSTKIFTLTAASTSIPTPTWTLAPSDTPHPTIEIIDEITSTPNSDTTSNFSESEFQIWKAQANILLFEDMVVDPTKQRYVKTTLEEIGLAYVDVGNATGRLKEYLVVGPEEGKQWDLIIVAVEARGQVSGELFDYIHQALGAGTSVIIEEWMLDRIFKGKVKPILQECGVQVENYYAPPGIRLNYMLEPNDPSHPLLNEPNGDLNFKDVVLFWKRDIGDLMSLTGSGDATILLKQIAAHEPPNGVLAVCIQGRLILQTFSSHNFPIDTMVKAWENYIHNALKARYQYLQNAGS